tara:strand:- start:15228 stop:15851 length:624 start_codon:yes stop_codon:yes gene_type:complete
MSIQLAVTKMLPFLQQGTKAAATGKFIRRALIPNFQADPLGAGIQAALIYGPDVLLIPALTAFGAPEGTGALTRLGMAGEEAIGGLGLSVLGQTAGLGVGRKLFKQARYVPNPKINPKNPIKDIVNPSLTGLQAVGDITAQLTARPALPRPIQTGVWNKLAMENEEALRRQIREEEIAKNSALVDYLLTGAGLQNPAINQGLTDTFV